MRFIIDGYNLVHAGRSGPQRGNGDLQGERERLIDRLAAYRRKKQCEMTVVFDGWQGGWVTEGRDRQKGIDLIFSKLGEKADEVIKRIVQEQGSAAVVVTSDREVSQFSERLSVSVIPSEQFLARITERILPSSPKGDIPVESERGEKKKGPSRRLSKKERRKRSVLNKL